MENTGKQFRKRNAILASLRQSAAHPSADDLYEQLKEEHSDISIASIYRNLTFFKEQGLIISLGTVNGIERFDGRVDPHVHFACSHCGSVTDVPNVVLPASIAGEVSDMLECSVEDARLMYTGTCRKCREAVALPSV